MADVTLPELVQMSDHILRAKVLTKTSAWNGDKTQIFTTVVLRVDASFSGRLADSSEVKVVIPGGIVDGLAMEVEHSPVFAIGEDVIVLLTDVDVQSYRVSGWEAGKFTIKNGQIAEYKLPLAQFKQQLESAIKSVGKR